MADDRALEDELLELVLSGGDEPFDRLPLSENIEDRRDNEIALRPPAYPDRALGRSNAEYLANASPLRGELDGSGIKYKAPQFYAEGGAVEDEQGFTLDDLQSQGLIGDNDPETTGSVPEQGLTFDDLKAKGLIGEDPPEQGLTFEDLKSRGLIGTDPPEPEGKLMTAAREAVAYAPAAIGAVPAMGAGAALGAAVGAPFAGIGAIPGAAIGAGIGAITAGLGAGWAISSATDWVRDQLGINDKEQRAVNAEENPISSFVGQAAPQLGAFGIGAATRGARVVGAAIGGGLEAIQNKVFEGEVHPWRVAGAAALGGALATPNRVGERLLGMGQKPGQTVGEWLRDRYQATRAPQTNNGSATAPAASPANVAPSTPAPVTGSPRTYPNPTAAPASPPAPVLPNGVAPDTLAALEGAMGRSTLKGEGFTPEQVATAPVSKPVVDTGDWSGKKPFKINMSEPGEAGPAPDMSGFIPERTINPETGVPEPHGIVDFQGLKIAVENLGGETRRGKGPEGDWEVKMPVPYGEIEGTRGADGDKVDAFMGPHPESKRGLIIEQRDLKTGKFDEHKVMLGFENGEQAVKAYVDSFSDGKGQDRILSIHEAPMDYIRNWLHGDTRKRIVDEPTVKAPKKPKKSPMDMRALDEEPTPRGEADFGDAAIAAAEKAGIEPEVSPQVIAPAPPKPGNKRPTISMGAAEKPVTATVKPETVAEIKAAAEAKGMNDLARAVETAPLTEEKAAKLRRKLGVVKAPPTIPELPGVTFKNKALAERAAKAVGAVNEAFAQAAPPKVNFFPTSKAEIAKLRERLTAAVKHTETGKDENGELYRPKDKTKVPSYAWLDVAKEFLAGKDTFNDVKNFMSAERAIRSGNMEAVKDVVQTKRIKADSELRRGPTADAADAARAKQHVFELPADDESALGVPQPVHSAADLAPSERAQVEQAILDEVKRAPDGRRVLPDLTVDPEAFKPAQIVKDELQLKYKAERKAPVEKAAPEKPAVRKVELTEEAKLAALASLDKAQAREQSRAAPKPTAAEAPGKLKKVIDTFDKFTADEAGGGKLFERMDKAIQANAVAAARAREPGYIAKDANSVQETRARELDNNLQKLDQEDVNHLVAQQKAIKAMPAEFKADAIQEKIYLAREAGKLNTLTPEELAAYDKHLKDVFEQNDLLKANIDAIMPGMMGDDVANHTMRIRRGYKPDLDEGVMSGRAKDPVGGITGLSTGKKLPMYDRMFMALEDASGKRVVVSRRDEGDGLTVWTKYAATPVKIGDVELKAGNVIDVGNKKFLVREAMTPEIEANARFRDGQPARYYHNAMISAMLANHYMATTARHLQFMHELKTNPEFLQFAKRGMSAQEAERKGWEKTILPQFNRPGEVWHMDPRLKYVLDDYAHPGFETDALNRVRQLSRATTKLIFLIPTAHVMNVGAHWFVERGWDWINPIAYRRLAASGAKAIHDVYTQTGTAQQIRDAGGGSVYGGVLSQEPVRRIFEAAGQKLLRDNNKFWDPIAKTVGVDPRDLVNSIYYQSSKMMWAASDMFHAQAIIENQMKGMSLQKAIETAEQHIPNYRVPTTLITQGPTGRFLSKLVQDQAFTAFGRYHYGVFNSFAHMAKDLAQGDKAQKIDALGKLFALGLLVWVVKPVFDKMAKLVTGNEEAEAAPRGPLAPISHAIKSIKGEENITAAARGAFTTAPLLATAGETISNKDFAGREIVEPATVRSAFKGDMKAAGRAVVQEADHAARGLVAPYSMFMTGAQRDQNPAEVVRDAALDIKNPSERSVMYKNKLQKVLQQKEISRFRRPPSYAEDLYNRITGFR